MTPRPEILVRYPAWVDRLVDWDRPLATPDDRMRLAIRVARENVLQGGGPFGATVVEAATGRLVSVGMNLVLPLGNSVLHAETVAIMMAEARLGTHLLGGEGGPACELAASCEPCVMCLGAIHWSGLASMLCGATKEDVERIGFDEGPVSASSWAYVEARGLAVRREVCRAEAAEVLQLYVERNGKIY